MRLILAVVLLLTASAAQAAPRATAAFVCKMSFTSSDGFIREEIGFWVYSDGTVGVLDAMISHYNNKRPVSAKIERDTDRRLEFSWTLEDLEGNQRKRLGGKVSIPKVRYKATFIKATSAISLKARIVGADNKPSAQGACSPIKPRR